MREEGFTAATEHIAPQGRPQTWAARMRARNIKPGFFKNELLAELEPLARLLFVGLWCMADRSGRLEDRPKRIKGEVLPYDDGDVDVWLDQLAERGFLVRYEKNGCKYIEIKGFTKHQNPHVREAHSAIPGPDQDEHCARTMLAPDEHSADTVQAQCEAQPFPVDAPLIPDSLKIYTPLPPLQGAEEGVEGKKPRKTRRVGKDPLEGFSLEVVRKVYEWDQKWPKARENGSVIENSRPKAVAVVEGILREHPEVTLELLDEAVEAWLESGDGYANQMRFWFGPGKRGEQPPWRVWVRTVLTRRAMESQGPVSPEGEQ